MSNDHPTNGTDPWESEMSREFDKRVRDLHEAPLTFENVKGKALTIRRNRRIAVAGGILAAAAVIVPVAVFAGNGLGDSNKNIDPVTSPSPTQATDPNDPTPSEAPAGVLGVDYLEGTTWHRADGSTVELDEAYFSGIALGDQLVATSNDNGLTVDVIDANGNVEESFDTFSYPVANSDHTTIAYVATDGTLITRWADGEAAMGDGFVDGDTVAAVTGGPDCSETADGCWVFLNHGNGSPPEAIDSNGDVEAVFDEAVKFNDATNNGRVAAQTSFSDTGSCSEVYDERAGGIVFETCDYTFDQFSPEAAYLSGADAYRDGLGPGYIVILDAANGQEVTRWDATNGFAANWVWEDAEHLLISAHEQGEWRIYRLGTDGTSEQVLSSTEGDDTTPAFVLLG